MQRIHKLSGLTAQSEEGTHLFLSISISQSTQSPPRWTPGFRCDPFQQSNEDEETSSHSIRNVCQDHLSEYLNSGLETTFFSCYSPEVIKSIHLGSNSRVCGIHLRSNMLAERSIGWSLQALPLRDIQLGKCQFWETKKGRLF